MFQKGAIYVESSVLHVTVEILLLKYVIFLLNLLMNAIFLNAGMNTGTKGLHALLYNGNIILQYQNYSVQLRGFLSGLQSFRFCSYCLWQCELWYVYGYRLQTGAAFSTACQKARSLRHSENLLSIEVSVEVQ